MAMDSGGEVYWAYGGPLELVTVTQSEELDPVAVVEAFPELDLQLPALGHGGMKSAYRIGGQRQQVLKLVRMPLSENPCDGQPTILVRARREIEAMREINHPRIVQVLDGPHCRPISDRQHLWYIEPLFLSGTLADRLSEPWNEEDALRLLLGLIDAAEVLSDHNIVHRDIKPSNIVFDDDGDPVLLDLGIAYFHELVSLTESHRPSPMTEIYAAPEQFHRRRFATFDFRTDLFVIGIVIFQVLTGHHPFIDGDPEKYYQRLVQGLPCRSALDAAPIGRGTVEVVKRLLHPIMHRRYPTFEDLRAAVLECE